MFFFFTKPFVKKFRFIFENKNVLGSLVFFVLVFIFVLTNFLMIRSMNKNILFLKYFAFLTNLPVSRYIFPKIQRNPFT
jgi:hypothetical protein